MQIPKVLETALSRYTLGELEGEGGSGRVFRTTDEDGVMFAVKVLNPATATKLKRRRFKNEIAFASRAIHPNIISLVDHGVISSDGETAPFFVMPFVGASLRRLMSQGIGPSEALALFLQILDGVEAGHLLGAVHRDLKPENILYDARSMRVVIADWGIAQFTDDLLITLVETKPNERLANFEYAAPEQRRRGGVTDPRTDIYALGLILYEMFMGDVPHGTNCPKIADRHPDYAYLDDVVEAMRSQSQDARPASIAAIKQRLASGASIAVAEQRLSILKDTVVPVTTVDDPLVVDPIRLEKVEFLKGRIYFVFHRTATDRWFGAFQRMNWQNAPAGKKPSAYQFHGNAVSVEVSDEREAEQIIKMFEPWIPRTNEEYRVEREREHQTMLAQRRQALKIEADKAERDRKILEAIRRASGSH